jgi:hypothetical protein
MRNDELPAAGERVRELLNAASRLFKSTFLRGSHSIPIV